ncbi:MAG TPA: aryl-sulfate sulfotransferase [Myxococcota bacterium]|nr:aryl-sulfate sulfotransferase [Myxococcota bacterium]
MIWLLACGSGIHDVDAVLSEDIHTVLTVSWATDEPTQGHVEYWTDGDPAQTGLTELGTEHQATLFAPADTTVSFKIVVPEGRGDESGTTTAETGALPLDLPILELSGQAHDAFMTVPLIGQVTGPLILDGAGNILWYHLDDRGLDVYRARLSLDGESLLYNAASVSGNPDEGSELVRISLDGSSVETVSVPLLAHDFVELPDGTIAAMVVEYRDYEGEALRGDSIVEIAPDGTQTTVWSSWDCWDVEETLDDPDLGWTFANALDYHDGGYLLGMRNFSSIARIDRDGTCDWVFGRTGATFEAADGSATFLHQHQFELFDGRLLVFDNEGLAGSQSRVLEYDFDPDAGLAEEIWSYSPTPSIYSFVLGDVARMDDGDTLVTWSASGQIDRVTADGEATWTLNTPVGYVLGFDTVSTSLYPQ